MTLAQVEQIFTSEYQVVNLNGGQLYGIALISNGTVTDLLTQNPSNELLGSIHGFLSFEQANPDGISHVCRLGQNLWGFEDMVGGGDLDFNDMILKVDYSVLS